MKGLFLVYHGFSEHSGISKKIKAQCEALNRSGETELCHTEISSDGVQCRKVGKTTVCDFGRGPIAKIRKRVSFGDVVDYIRREGVDFLYVRHDFNANPFTINLLRRIKKLGVRIALEIPTYPYDSEFDGAPFSVMLRLRIDQLFRRRMARYADRIVTFSDCERIFGRPTIRISNGIDFASISLKTQRHDTTKQVRLLAVANIHFWHGLDRVIEGMKRYYAAPHDREVCLRIVGDGSPRTLGELTRLIAQSGLSEHICLAGTRSGEALDAEFEWCDMGIASLGRHRNGITSIKTLKNREYAARGIPFVYSEQDSDFDHMPYVMKAPADDSPLDIAALLRFHDSVNLCAADIRASIEGTLCWNNQMRQVLKQLFEA